MEQLKYQQIDYRFGKREDDGNADSVDLKRNAPQPFGTSNCFPSGHHNYCLFQFALDAVDVSSM